MMSYQFPWPQALTAPIATLPSGSDKPAGEVVYLKPALDVDSLPSKPIEVSEAEPSADEPSVELLDWAGVIDTINGLGEHAKRQDARLREQEGFLERTMEKLRQELLRAEQRVEAAEAQMRDVKAEADSRVKLADERARALQQTNEDLRSELRRAQEQIKCFEAQTHEVRQQADTRIQDMQTRTDVRVRIAEDRAKTAELKADAALGWLKRIERATKSLSESTGAFPCGGAIQGL